MEFSEFAFRVLLLFFPGVICTLLADSLMAHRERKPFDILVLSFVNGLTAYFIYWTVLKVGLPIHWLDEKLHLDIPTQLQSITALQDRNLKLSFGEIGLVCVIAVIQGAAISFASKFKSLHAVARTLGITKKSGELDVWGYSFNSKQVQYATVRDYERDLVYDGWVQAFSDDGKRSELLLRDVGISRNSDGALLYDVGAVYLELKENKWLAVEFRDQPFTEEYQEEIRKRYASTTSSASSAAPTKPPESATPLRGNGEEGRGKPASNEPASSSSSSAASLVCSEKALIAAFRCAALTALGVYFLKFARRNFFSSRCDCSNRTD